MLCAQGLSLGWRAGLAKLNVLLSVLVIAAISAIHLLAGGRSHALSLPSYGIIGAAALLSAWRVGRRDIPRDAIPCLAASLGFVGYIAVRAMFSPEDYLARRDLYLVLAALAVYLLVAVDLASAEVRGRLVFVILLLGAAHVVVGAIQFTKGGNFMPFASLPRPDYATRASGFFGYPNHLAGFLEPALLLGLGVVCWSRWRPWVKVMAGYLVAVCAAGIVLTGSRGGYISTVAGLVVFALLSFLLVGRRMGWHWTVAATGTVFIAVMMAFSVQWAMKENPAQRAGIQLTSDMGSARLMLWKVAAQQFQAHPVFGAGSGMYLYYSREFKPPGIQADPEFVHNDGLQLLAEYGLVGGVVFILFLTIHMRRGWKSFQTRPATESETLAGGSSALPLTTGALSAVAACLVHAGVDFTLHSPAIALVVAFVFGVLARQDGVGDASRSKADGTFPLGLPFRVVMTLLGICLLGFTAAKLPAEIYAERARQILAGWQYMESPQIAHQAVQLAKRGIDYDARNPELHYFLGEALIAQALKADPAEQERLHRQAALAFRKALALAPNDARLLLCLASALDALQRFDEAGPLYAEAIRRDPLSRYAHWAYGHHFEAQHRLDEAEAAYQHSLRIGAGETATMALDRIAELRKSAVKDQPPGAPATPEATTRGN